MLKPPKPIIAARTQSIDVPYQAVVGQVNAMGTWAWADRGRPLKSTGFINDQGFHEAPLRYELVGRQAERKNGRDPPE